MALKQGSISIDTENIFPIIKKWLYSDKDIFIRELISNGCDAISKYKRLVSLGEVKQSEENKEDGTSSILPVVLIGGLVALAICLLLLLIRIKRK